MQVRVVGAQTAVPVSKTVNRRQKQAGSKKPNVTSMTSRSTRAPGQEKTQNSKENVRSTAHPQLALVRPHNKGIQIVHVDTAGKLNRSGHGPAKPASRVGQTQSALTRVDYEIEMNNNRTTYKRSLIAMRHPKTKPPSSGNPLAALRVCDGNKYRKDRTAKQIDRVGTQQGYEARATMDEDMDLPQAAFNVDPAALDALETQPSTRGIRDVRQATLAKQLDLGSNCQAPVLGRLESRTIGRNSDRRAAARMSMMTQSTLMGEVPLHEWTAPFDFEEMARLNEGIQAHAWPGRSGVAERNRLGFLKVFNKGRTRVPVKVPGT